LQFLANKSPCLRKDAREDQGYYDGIGLIGIAYALSIDTKIIDLWTTLNGRCAI